MDALEYQLLRSLNLYGSATGEGLVTQAQAGRQVQIIQETANAVAVRLCEDDYFGWILQNDRSALTPATTPYRSIAITPQAIEEHLPVVIAFCQAAMAQPHCYLWGGTIAPDYDCSGLMQAAFQSVGIWIPRDAYQQEAFLHPLPLPLSYPLDASDLQEVRPGDLIFFGSPTQATPNKATPNKATPSKATHVGLYLGEGRYIHSSGKDQGRNGIGVDTLFFSTDLVSQSYGKQLRGAGRVIAPYVSSGRRWDGRG